MIRLCTRPWCRHEALPDSRECREHLIETLRETRPAALRVTSPWVQRAERHELPAKVA